MQRPGSHPGADKAESVPVAETAAAPEELAKSTRSSFELRSKRPNFVLSVVLTVIKLLFVVVLVAVVAEFSSVIGVANASLESTPELDTHKIEDQSLSSYI